VELDGLKKAHIRDGAAVVQYLVWLDKKVCIFGSYVSEYVHFLDEDSHVFSFTSLSFYIFISHFNLLKMQNFLTFEA